MHRSRVLGILIDTPAAQADAAVAFWSAALGVAAERISVVGNGVDTEVFTPDGPAESRPGPYLVYAGTMSQWQGVDVLATFAARPPAARRCA